MVSKIIIFLGAFVMAFCFGKMVNEVSKEINWKKKIIIVFILEVTIFLIFFLKLDVQVGIFDLLICLVCAGVETTLEMFLEKFIPL